MKKSMENYSFRKIEKKWQNFWEKKKFYRAKDFDKKTKKYILVEFPYPSGDGLHVGHIRSYSALDAIARKKRMEGFNVLYPIGWDAFGLPAENYAIKKGIHPSIITKRNINVFKRQLKSLGLSFDWSREINTTDPNYYKWTQWIFLQLFKNGLAYQAEMPINWCPKCKIGLANEEVIGGECERCGAGTEKRNIKQWVLKITKYADKLINDLDKVDYLEKIKTQQINWIGRSEGITVIFPILTTSDVIKTSDVQSIEVFTTRVDTLFGVTALVVAPEHETIKKLKSKIKNWQEVEEYIKNSAKKGEMERTTEEKEKTGVKLDGIFAVNPANNEKVPVFTGDYVVASYGGGAVMMVPAHDKRDYAFAKKYNLSIKKVVAPPKLLHMTTSADTIASGGKAELRIEAECFIDDGELINSGKFSGIKSEEARKEIAKWLEEKGAGKKTIHYKLRDWIFSRQHYWGEPIPIIHCDKCGIVSVPEKDLPVKLPFVKKYKPTNTGESPLAAMKKWVNVKCPKCGGKAQRETDTMPNWAGSSWYFLRYADPKNKKSFADFKKLKYWTPVDLYNGGMEHTTLHLLYSRFWHKFLYDIKTVPTFEPYSSRRSHGMVLAEDSQKMSKSRGNVVNPDEIVKNFGADSLRVYEMFMGPFDQAISWSNQGVIGAFRFLNRIWQLQKKVKNLKNGCRQCETIIHKSIKKISEDIDDMKFNTAISQLMILSNELDKDPVINIENYKIFLKLLFPFAPHISEELWSRTGNKKSINEEKWPEYDPAKIKEENFDLIIQINGKMRGKVSAPMNISEGDAKELALSQEFTPKILNGKEPRKIIFVQNRLINIVL